MKEHNSGLLEHHGITVLFEDEHVIAVNKPPNLLVLPDRYNSDLPFLTGILGKARGKVSVVHRIDKETSGVILFARTSEAHAALNHDFRKKLVRKTYVALVRGTLADKEGKAEMPLSPSRRKKGMMIVDWKGGKESRTAYAILEEFGGYALVEAKPETGRTHQVRVHLSALGLPLVADSVYGDGQPLLLSSFKRRYKSSGEERPLISRTALHASMIVVKHPALSKRLEISAELPKDMRAALRALKKYSQ